MLQNLDLNGLHNVVTSWQGKQYTGCIPDEVCKKILQELFTISFKLDVGMTDCYLYWLQLEGFDTSELEEGKAVTFDELDASTCEEHHVKVASFQPGFTGEGNTDFSLWDVAKWRAVMHKLYFVMLSWDGMLGMGRDTCKCAEKLLDSCTSTNDSYPKYAIAFHFVAMFADFFKCTLVLPHVL